MIYKGMNIGSYIRNAFEETVPTVSRQMNLKHYNNEQLLKDGAK